MPVNWQENRYDKRKTKVNLAKDSFKFMINLIKLRIRLLFMTDQMPTIDRCNNKYYYYSQRYNYKKYAK